MRKFLGFLCIAVSMAVLGFGVHMYMPKFMDYKKSRDLYNDIEKNYTSVPEDIILPWEENELPVESPQETAVRKYETEGGIQWWEPFADTEGLHKQKAAAVRKLTGKSLPAYLLDNGVDRKHLNDFLPINVDGNSLKQENDDYLGWIYIPRTTISYPVVLSKDNADYLHTNFYHEYNYPGTIFMDFRNRDLRDHHTILYGHNMRDGSMFAGIKAYNEQEFADTHPFIWVITPKYNLLYRVFSSYISSPLDPKTFALDRDQFSTNLQWHEIVQEIQERSLIRTDVNVSGLSFVISLSTCTDDSASRNVVSAVLIGNYSDGSEK